MSEETTLWALRWNAQNGLDFVEERKVDKKISHHIRDLFENEEPNVFFIAADKKPKVFLLYEK